MKRYRILNWVYSKEKKIVKIAYNINDLFTLKKK